MTLKKYNLKYNGEGKGTIEEFRGKMSNAGYIPDRIINLTDESFHPSLAIYDIEPVILFVNSVGPKIKEGLQLGDVEIGGRDEDRNEIKKRLEQKTGFILEEIIK